MPSNRTAARYRYAKMRSGFETYQAGREMGKQKTEELTPAPVPAKAAPPSILNPTTFQEAREFAAIIAGSDLAPKDYKGKPDNVLVAMQMGAEVGLNPMQAIQNIAVINGRPSIWGDAMLAICQSSPECEYIVETFDDSTMTATCRAKRRGNPENVETFSQKDAATGGLWGKGGPWTQYPKRMLGQRARGFCLRGVFADALRGLHHAEEVRDYAIKDITPERPENWGTEPPGSRSDDATKVLEGQNGQADTEASPEPDELVPPTFDAAMLDATRADHIFDTALEAGETMQAAWDAAVKEIYDNCADRAEQKVIGGLCQFYKALEAQAKAAKR